MQNRDTAAGEPRNILKSGATELDAPKFWGYRSSHLQVLIEAETAGHERHSIMLQNAETVRLVGHQQALAAQNDIGNEPCSWLPVPVTELRTGDNVLLHMQPGARHTGIAVQESIVEK